jgi:hypothetical protein
MAIYMKFLQRLFRSKLSIKYVLSGITLIPPESLKQFRDIIIKANNHFKAKELQLLTEKITEAITGNKYLIHYGI